MDGTLLDLLQSQVAEHAEKPLYSFFDRHLQVNTSLSYQGLYERASDMASRLQKNACVGRPVVIYCPHGHEFIVAFFGCVLAGALPVPVARQRSQSGPGLEALLKASGANIVISTSVRTGCLLAIRSRLSVRVLYVDENQGLEGSYCRPKLSCDDVAFIQFTSGSTSSPRGVVISHANVMDNCAQIRQAFGCSSEDVGVSWLPFHHDMGLIGHIMQPLYSGLHNYFINPVDFMARPARWLQAISDVGGTISGGPDFAFALATERIPEGEVTSMTLHQWRLAYCGAEKIRPETLQQFSEKFSPAGFRHRRLFPCYGLAESTLFVSGQYGVATHQPVGSESGRSVVCVGRPATGTAVSIVHPVHGNRVAEGETGEVCVSSASVANCYCHDPEASRRAFGLCLDDGRRYVRTGDMGFLRDDRLYLLGRYKNVIKRRGCSYHAEDIEAALTLDLCEFGVARCAAFTLHDRDPEMLVVLLEISRKAGREHDIDDARMIDLAAARILEQFGIAADDIKVLPANALPLTSSGKIRRQACSLVYRRQSGLTSGPDLQTANGQDVAN